MSVRLRQSSPAGGPAAPRGGDDPVGDARAGRAALGPGRGAAGVAAPAAGAPLADAPPPLEGAQASEAKEAR